MAFGMAFGIAFGMAFGMAIDMAFGMAIGMAYSHHGLLCSLRHAALYVWHRTLASIKTL
jgi:hypothetical protein